GGYRLSRERDPAGAQDYEKPCRFYAMMAPWDAAMRRFSLAAAAAAAAMVLGPHPGPAYFGNSPWCAVVNVGEVTSVVGCVYRSFEPGQPTVIVGNRASFNTTPYWAGQLAASPQRKLSRKRVRH